MLYICLVILQFLLNCFRFLLFKFIFIIFMKFSIKQFICHCQIKNWQSFFLAGSFVLFKFRSLRFYSITIFLFLNFSVNVKLLNLSLKFIKCCCFKFTSIYVWLQITFSIFFIFFFIHSKFVKMRLFKCVEWIFFINKLI